MPSLEQEVEIQAPVESVWRVLSDPTYIPKLYRDAMSVELDPPGPAAVGQKCRVRGMAHGITVASTVQFTRVEKEVAIEGREVPGQMFSLFDQKVWLTRNGWDTIAKVMITYELRPEFRAKLPDPSIVEGMLNESFQFFGKSLKELSELIPLPE